MKAFIIILLVSAVIVSPIIWASTAKAKVEKLSKIIFFLSLPLLLTVSCIRVIDAQEVGVIVRPSGIEKEPLFTGWHFIALWNRVYVMDRTLWVYTCSEHNKRTENEGDAIWVPTVDGIKIGFSVSVSWRIDPNYAPWIFQNVRDNEGNDNSIKAKYKWLQENVIRTKLKSSIAIAANQFTPIECYSNKRNEIKTIAFNIMQKEAAAYKLIIDQIDLRETYYNKEYEVSINEKKLAEQEALRLIEVTKQKKEKEIQAAIEKNIAILKAEGEAKALQIKGQAVSITPK
jgi:regulator of protease activity HflC (stomatin/prohibitin superfamily)